MDQSQSQSAAPLAALTTAAAMMRAVWRGILCGFGKLRGEPDSELAIHNWISAIFRRLDDMLARHQAGKLLPVTISRVVRQGREVVTESPEASPPAKRIRQPLAVPMPQTVDASRAERAARVGKQRQTSAPDISAISGSFAARCDDLGASFGAFFRKNAFGRREKLRLYCSG